MSKKRDSILKPRKHCMRVEEIEIMTPEKARGGKWIQDTHMKKGALHRELKIPKGQKIPLERLEKAAHGNNSLLKKRANLAITLKRFSNRNG